MKNKKRYFVDLEPLIGFAVCVILGVIAAKSLKDQGRSDLAVMICGFAPVAAFMLFSGAKSLIQYFRNKDK